MSPSISFSAWLSLAGSLSVLAPLLLVGVLLWAVTRTRSAHIVMFRLWRLASGGSEIQDEKIRSYFQDQHALMSFRFVTGLVLHQTSDVHALIDWSRQRQIDIAQVSRAGQYFDPHLKRVDLDKLPKKWRSTGMLFAAVTSWFLALLAGLMFALFFDEALVKFTTTGSYFAIKPESARRIPPWAATFRVIDCDPRRENEQSGFSVAEQEILCKAFRDPKAQQEIAQNIGSQRNGFVWLLLALIVATVINTWAIERVRSARKLAAALDDQTQRAIQRRRKSTDSPGR